jgi:hypothetical protein
MKKQIVLFLFTLSFSQVHAEIIKCNDVSSHVRYESTETQQGRQEIQALKDKGMVCNNIDKRTPEQKIIDAKAWEDRIRIENELARKHYHDAVRATAKFFDDVDEERKKNKRHR